MLLHHCYPNFSQPNQSTKELNEEENIQITFPIFWFPTRRWTSASKVHRCLLRLWWMRQNIWAGVTEGYLTSADWKNSLTPGHGCAALCWLDELKCHVFPTTMNFNQVWAYNKTKQVVCFIRPYPREWVRVFLFVCAVVVWNCIRKITDITGSGGILQGCNVHKVPAIEGWMVLVIRTGMG